MLVYPSLLGFDACVCSNVLAGSGLSSSAAFEILLGTIENHLTGAQLPAMELAKIGQAAENRFFGKPCGLLDQAAAASGGVVFIDFAPGKEPVSETIDVDFENYGYALVVIDSGADHAGLTDDYASIPKELHKEADTDRIPFALPFGTECRENPDPQIYHPEDLGHRMGK